MLLSNGNSRCMEASGGTSHVVAGPWGGDGGTWWNDGAYGAVRQVIISYGSWIDSVQIEYVENDNNASVWSERHGGWSGARTDQVKLDQPDEYLVSISGFYGPASTWTGTAVVVRSLSLESNRRQFGPFGSQSGTHFSFSLTGGAKIAGFHGRSGNQLHAIGVHIKPFFTVVPVEAHNFLAQARNRGFGGFGGLEMNEKLFSGEIVKVNPNRQVERETLMASSGYPESDQTYDDQKVFLSYNLPVRGQFPNAIQQESEIVYYVAPLHGYERKEKKPETYPNMEQMSEDLYNTRLNDANLFTTPNRGFVEYETKQKVYSNSKSSAQNGKVVTQAVSYGPWGGSGSMVFDDGVYSGVREIHLYRSSAVVSIRIFYDNNGHVVCSDKHGGTSAYRIDKIILDYPNEVLTRISGYYGSINYRGPEVVKSLTFFTNKNKYGPFGDERGVSFSSTQNEGVIVGFHGSNGSFLNSIGIHFQEKKLLRPSFDSNPTISSTDNKFSDKKVLSGPVSWDDGVHTGIKKIYITKGVSFIHAIQIQYNLNGQSKWSNKHGSNNEGSCHVIQFEYPQEVVTSISGYYGSIGSIGDNGFKTVVKSLTFHTNKRKYGPYGEETGTYFTSSNSNHQTKIVGFYGSSGTYLYSIGVHTQRQPSLDDRLDQTTPPIGNGSPTYVRLIHHF